MSLSYIHEDLHYSIEIFVHMHGRDDIKRQSRRHNQFICSSPILSQCTRAYMPRGSILGLVWATPYLPKIKVDDSTGPKFMNLIAYEMSSDFQSNFGDVTSYICFLHLLIHHVDDVKHLKEKYILENSLRSEEDVAQLFKERGIQFVPNNDIYRIVKTKIEDHCTTKWKT